MLDQVNFTGETIDPNDFPGMIGYIVQPGDNLWSIAKKYRMSIERIREVNQDNKESAVSLSSASKSGSGTAANTMAAKNETDDLGTKPGQKLLLVR